jgi:transcription elongation GreA/GreB family factor
VEPSEAAQRQQARCSRVPGGASEDLVGSRQRRQLDDDRDRLARYEWVAKDLAGERHVDLGAAALDELGQLLGIRLPQSPSEIVAARRRHPSTERARDIIAAAMARRPHEEYRRDPEGSSLEDDWIEEVERAPADVDWFLDVAESLVSEGESERARGLLDLWDDALKEAPHPEARLELLRRFGALLHKGPRLQREVVATLEQLWGSKPNFRSTLDWAGLRKSVDDPGKLWDRVTRLGSVMAFDAGEIVAMQGQGVGRVVEVNLALETLRIDFEKRSGVTLGFRAAAKMLRPLPSGHPLRRKLEDPEGLARMRDEEPSELLRVILEDAGRPLTAGEIREALAGIVSEAQWSAWWARARKHPQVVTMGSGRQSYRWEASAAGALDAVRRSFERADPRRALEIFRRNLDRDDALAADLAATLGAQALRAKADDPGLAWEIFFALERAGRLPAELAGLVDELLAPAADVARLFSGIEDRLLRERALTMARERRQDWTELYQDRFLREEDPRVLSLIADGLASVDRILRDRLMDDIVAQPRRAPAAFAWLAERAADDADLRSRSPLRLLQQILLALGAEELAGQRIRLRELVESGGTLPRLVAHLDEEQAAAALESLGRSTALEAFQREALGNAVRLRFPALADEGASKVLYATAAAIAAKRAELARLTEVEIPANRKAIEEARALGDLRENFEYKAARQRHEYLNARLAALHRELARARPIDFGALDTSEVRIGARVRLLDANGGERALSILGPWDSRPEQGVISYESELGQKLLGLKPGDPAPVGSSTLTVVAIEPAGEPAAQLPSPK